MVEFCATTHFMYSMVSVYKQFRIVLCALIDILSAEIVHDVKIHGQGYTTKTVLYTVTVVYNTKVYGRQG